MVTRKQFMAAGDASVAAPLALQACAPADAPDSYETSVNKIWHPASSSLSGSLALQRDLVHNATLAPAGHNTQCWKLHVKQDSISILPDLSRRTPVVDPDAHHLFVSLGYALENLAQASLAYGLKALPQFDATKDVVTVKLTLTTPLATPLFKAITDRPCTRDLFDGKAFTLDELKALELAGTGSGVRMPQSLRRGLEDVPV